MPHFKEVTIEDKDWIKKIFSTQKVLSCEYTFGNIFSYSAKFPIFVAEAYGCFVSKCIIDGEVSYCFPTGDGDYKKAVEFIIEDAKLHSGEFSIFGINSAGKDFLLKEFSQEFTVNYDRDGMDYIYLSTDLIQLKGKKFQPKRNHISFFEKNYIWQYESVTAENIKDCIDMSENWLYQSNHADKTDLDNELKIIKKVAENFDALGYKGALIRIDGEVVAYSLGEEITDDTFCVHFEKAYPGIRGAYPIINREFVKNELSSYKFINREDDVGSENLRKAKLSYQPVMLLDEYEAVYNKNASQ